MPAASPDPDSVLTVHCTGLRADDTPEQYRQKLARIALDSMVQFVGLSDASVTNCGRCCNGQSVLRTACETRTRR